MTRQPSPEHRQTEEKEPLLLWWMPVVALIAPLIAAAWLGVSADEDALEEAAIGLVWPGLPAYFGTLAVFWLGWKIDLE